MASLASGYWCCRLWLRRPYELLRKLFLLLLLLLLLRQQMRLLVRLLWLLWLLWLHVLRGWHVPQLQQAFRQRKHRLIQKRLLMSKHRTLLLPPLLLPVWRHP